MAAALSRKVTLPVANIIASFMEFAPGVPNTDELLIDMMLAIRKKYVDELEFMHNETTIRVGEKYKIQLRVLSKHFDEDDMSYSLDGLEISGYLMQLREGSGSYSSLGALEPYWLLHEKAHRC